MKTPRLLSAAAALLLLVAALTMATIYAERIEARSVHALAAQMFVQKNQGVALQRAAFRQPDLLPFYGSSDLNARNPYHASALFRSYPTGFTVFPVGNAGSTSLIWLQALAAVGSDLRGKKVAVSLSVRPFLNDMADVHAYSANFSPLHASELAFSCRLSFTLKQEVARRMLQYPETVAPDRLLRFALERLADGSWMNRALYYASLPLGKLHNLVLCLQDRWETLVFLRAQRGVGPVGRQPADLDWAALLSRAEEESLRKAEGNLFGFESTFWATHGPDIAMQKGMYPSGAADHSLERSAEWTDLDLLLRVITTLGGEPLVLSVPINGVYYDYLGVPFATRRAYYERLRNQTEAHEAHVSEFADHDGDRYFSVDPVFHLSDKGWIYYADALDGFFHDRRSAHL